ncbi:hypothetical protein ACQZ4R_12540 [Agrobacterium vitis]
MNRVNKAWKSKPLSIQISFRTHRRNSIRILLSMLKCSIGFCDGAKTVFQADFYLFRHPKAKPALRAGFVCIVLMI